MEAQKVRLMPVELPTAMELHQQLIQAREINDSPMATRDVRSTAESWICSTAIGTRPADQHLDEGW